MRVRIARLGRCRPRTRGHCASVRFALGLEDTVHRLDGRRLLRPKTRGRGLLVKTFFLAAVLITMMAMMTTIMMIMKTFVLAAGDDDDNRSDDGDEDLFVWML